jgi:hypothetical protein
LRLSLRQRDVSERAGVSRQKVTRLERGELDGLTLRDIEGCFEALGARVELRVRWRGAALDRLIDEGHARLVDMVVAILRQTGWTVELETTFSHYGERGSIDILAWHPPTRNLLVIEIKTEIASVEGLLRPLDLKARIAPLIASQRFGWRPAHVSRLVVLPEDSSARRALARHTQIFASALPVRSQAVRRWLAHPGSAIAGLSSCQRPRW